MASVVDDLRAEVDELHAFVVGLVPRDWETPTLFKDWTPWDVIAHLHYFDGKSLLAARDPEAFAADRDSVVKAMLEGRSVAALARGSLGALSPDALCGAWRDTAHELTGVLGAMAPKARLPWYGPDMGVQMFTTARYMETWAHGQEIYDLKGAPRTHTDRIKHVAVIGVKTFGWTFVNRGLEVPGTPPYVRLTAPSGAVWEWNEPNESEYIRGDAVGFCQTVTQTRNVADTSLEVAGEVANRWMAIAQCFAGGPVDPPAPGIRVGA